MSLGNTLLGIPLVFWGLGCLAVAVAYYRIWPQPSPKRSLPRTQWQHIVLRYFHSLVWILLAAGCFLASVGNNIGLWVAALALPVYIVFLVMVVQDRNRELADLAAQRKAQTTATSGSGPSGASSGTKTQPSVNAKSSTPGPAAHTVQATTPAPSSGDKPETQRSSGSVSK